MRRLTIWALGALVALGAAALVWVALERHRLSKMILAGDGAHDVTVRVDPHPLPPCRVRATWVGREAAAEEMEQSLEGDDLPERRVVDIPGFDGRPFVVVIPFSTRETGLGERLAYYQPALLVLWIDREGMPRQRVVVALPDLRRTHVVTVSLERAGLR
jgi:hypothetical protein